MNTTLQLREESIDKKVALKPKVSIKLVTPEVAEEWLINNPRNRAINKDSVLLYKKEMLTGRWQFNNASIALDKNCTLMDGQHRLAAIVSTGIPREMIIVENLEPEAFSTIDTGRKRTTKDIFAIKGYIYCMELGGAANLIWMFSANAEIQKYKFKERGGVTADDLLDIVEKNPDIQQSCIKCNKEFRTFGVYGGRVNVAALYYLFSRKDESLANEMFSQLNSGAIADPNSIILQCRNLLIQEKINQRTRRTSDNAYRVSLIVRTWNFLRDGMRDTRLVQDYSLPIPIIK